MLAAALQVLVQMLGLQSPPHRTYGYIFNIISMAKATQMFKLAVTHNQVLHRKYVSDATPSINSNEVGSNSNEYYSKTVIKSFF